MPLFDSFGQVQLAMPAVDVAREAKALESLQEAAKGQLVPFGTDSNYLSLMTYLQGIAGLLDRPAREAMFTFEHLCSVPLHYTASHNVRRSGYVRRSG